MTAGIRARPVHQRLQRREDLLLASALARASVVQSLDEIEQGADRLQNLAAKGRSLLPTSLGGWVAGAVLAVLFRRLGRRQPKPDRRARVGRWPLIWLGARWALRAMRHWQRWQKLARAFTAL